MSNKRGAEGSDERGGDLAIHPLTPERWDDLVVLFGERGAYSGCWCMWWRLTGREFGRQAGAGNRAAFKSIVEAGRVPGLLAYRAGRPIGWCSVAPREEFGRILRSRFLQPTDAQPVWSIVCFYIDRDHRQQGVAVALLQAAVRYAAERGAKIVESYPIDPGRRQIRAADLYPGLVSMYQAAGFREVARSDRGRPIMRFYLEASSPA